MSTTITLNIFALTLLSGSILGEQSKMSEPITTYAISKLGLPAKPFYIEAEQVSEIIHKMDITVEELLQQLVPVAQQFSRPSVSNYYVGVAALGKSGAIYLGANLEFDGVALNQTVHAEQFLVANARNHGETELVALALSAPPCGHCRQFLYEANGNGNLKLFIQGKAPIQLSSLLPMPFGPQHLGITESILSPVKGNYAFTMDYSLRTFALMAAVYSYAPFSNCRSGVAIQTSDGQIYKGSYLETAAFNPSLSPMQVALVALVADGREYSEITSALLMEQEIAQISQVECSREVLKNIAPEAEFTVLKKQFVERN